MYQFIFTADGCRFSLPAKSLHEAVACLPHHLKRVPKMAVTMHPIENETAYLKARCAYLEHTIQELLHGHRARA